MRPRECRHCNSICRPYIGKRCIILGGKEIPKNRKLLPEVDIYPGNLVAVGTYKGQYGAKVTILGGIM